MTLAQLKTLAEQPTPDRACHCRDRKHELATGVRSFLDSKKAKGERLSETEQADIDSIIDVCKTLNSAAESIDQIEANLEVPGQSSPPRDTGITPAVTAARSQSQSNRRLRLQRNDGSPVRVLGAGDPWLSDSQRAEDPDPWGLHVLNWLRGEPQTVYGQNATSPDAAGGFTVNERLAVRILESVHQRAVATQAGAVTVPMGHQSETFVKVSAPVVGGWRNELAAIPADELVFEEVRLTAKSFGVIIPLSIELSEDGTNVISTLENEMTRCLASAMDHAVLLGSGTPPEPTGIMNAVGVNEVGTVGAISSYAPITAAVKAVLANDYPGDVSELAWILDSTNGATFDGLADSTGQPLRPTPWSEKLNQFSTEKIGPADMIVGDFTETVIGIRAGLQLERFNTGTAPTKASGDLNLLSNYALAIRATMRMDVAHLRPYWLTKLTGITQA